MPPGIGRLPLPCPQAVPPNSPHIIQGWLCPQVILPFAHPFFLLYLILRLLQNSRTAKYSYRFIDDCLQSLYGPKVFQQPWIRMMTAVADAQRRWMCFAGALSGWPLGCPSSVLARHWQSSGALMRHHWGATHAQSTRRHQRGPSFF